MNEFPESHHLTLAGSPRQRGIIHGETMRGKIQDLIGSWKDWLVQGRGVSPDQYFQELVCETNFMKAIERWTPDLLEEVKGIAEGAGVDFTTIFAFQLQDEEWWFGLERGETLQDQTRRCSSIGWKGEAGSPSLVAQNMDMPDYLDGYQVVLHIKDNLSEVESLIFSAAGLIALNGVNNHSIGIVCNSLSQLNHSRDGLPVAYVHRGVLERKTFSEAKSFLNTIHHASGQNYILGSPTKIVDLECSTNQVTEYSQPVRSRSICHTNHPFVNTDFQGIPQGGKHTSEGLVESFDMNDTDSRIRFEVVFQQLGEAESNEANLDMTKRLFSSHNSELNPVCRHSKSDLRWMTLGTSIMVLDKHPQLHVCPGPPCTSKFTQFSFF